MAASMLVICCRFLTKKPLKTWDIRTCTYSTGFNKPKKISDKYLRKFIQSESQKKKKWFTNHVSPIPDGMKQLKATPGMIRRAQQLNVVLQQHVFECFYYEDLCPDLLQCNCEISKVAIAPDMNSLHIYWTATGDIEKDDQVAGLLSTCSSKLRSSLIAKRVTGRIPPIVFIKDGRTSQVNLIDELLKRADMGPDYIPQSQQIKASTTFSKFDDCTKNERKMQGIDFQGLENAFNRNAFVFADGPGAKLVTTSKIDFGDSSSRFSKQEEDIDHTEMITNINNQHLQYNHRDDLYNLDHRHLLNKVLQYKNRSTDRSYVVSDFARMDASLTLQAEQPEANQLNSYRINKLLKDSRRRSRVKVYTNQDMLSSMIDQEEIDDNLYEVDDDEDVTEPK